MQNIKAEDTVISQNNYVGDYAFYNLLSYPFICKNGFSNVAFDNKLLKLISFQNN